MNHFAIDEIAQQAQATGRGICRPWVQVPVADLTRSWATVDCRDCLSIQAEEVRRLVYTRVEPVRPSSWFDGDQIPPQPPCVLRIVPGSLSAAVVAAHQPDIDAFTARPDRHDGTLMWAPIPR